MDEPFFDGYEEEEAYNRQVLRDEELEWEYGDLGDEDDDMIAEHLGCPMCGERRVDWLQILEDAEHDVHCLACDTDYSFVVEPDIDSRREDYYQAGITPPNPFPL